MSDRYSYSTFMSETTGFDRLFLTYSDWRRRQAADRLLKWKQIRFDKKDIDNRLEEQTKYLEYVLKEK